MPLIRDDHEERQAIDDHDVTVGTVLSDRFGERQRFFHGLPMLWTAPAMAFDFAAHFVVRGLRRGHKNHPPGTLAELLRVVALAATHSS